MKTRPNSARGSTLFVVLFFMALLSVFVGAAFSLTSNTANIGSRSTQMTLAYAVADGAMELVYSRWRSVVSFSTNRNLNAAVFITPTSAYNAESKDITKVTLADLGLPAGYLGLSNDINAPLATITLQTVDASGRLYGSYDADGRCQDTDTTLVEGSRRSGYDASMNNFYPAPPATGPDYSFRVASANANGFQSLEMIYRVEVAVSVQTRTAPLVAKVRRHFTRSVANAAQAAYFYEDRLEIIPGTNTTIKGRVHTNKDLWIGDRTDVVLSFLSSVTFVEGATPVFKTNPTGAGAVPGFDEDTSLPFAAGQAPRNVPPMTVGGINRDYLKPYSEATGRGETNLSYNNNSMREIIEPPTTKSGAYRDASTLTYDEYWNMPADGGINQVAIEQARLYQQADIKIVLAYNADGSLNLDKTIVRGRTTNMADGIDASGTDSSQAGALGRIKAALTAATSDTTGPILLGGQRVAIEDRREATGTDTVKVTRVDLAQLKRVIEAAFFSNTGTPLYGYKGVVYMSDATYGNPLTDSSYDPFAYGTGASTFETNAAGGRVKHGLMLENGYSLPGSNAAAAADRNFTISTQNGVYVKGDYNTGADASGNPVQPPSNAPGADADAGTVGLVSGVPATTVTSSIMADAITVVSNNFNPSNAGLPINAVQTDGSGNPVLVDGVNVLARGAVATTVNSAVVTGQYQSNDNGYSGGSTNIIRFLENWTSPTDNTGTTVDGYNGGSSPLNFTYKGSIMQSYTSKEFSNKFLTPSRYGIYSPPQRRVIFDEGFLENPPVGFPGTITYTKGPWERPNA